MYRTAKHITVITPSFRENLVHAKHVASSKVSVIPNFADTNFIRPLPKVNPFSQRHNLSDKFVVSHAGNLGYVYDLPTLIQAAAKLRDEPDLLFLIVGDGVMRAQLQAQARELNVENVRFMDFVPYAELPYLRAASDVQVSLYRRGAARYSMPSKLYEIMASGRPVLASAEAGSDVVNLIAESGCGICVEPQNVDALVTALLEMKRDPTHRAEMSARGRAAAEERFSLETVVNQYDALLKSI